MKVPDTLNFSKFQICTPDLWEFKMLRLSKKLNYKTISGKHAPIASLVNVLSELQGVKKKFQTGRNLQQRHNKYARKLNIERNTEKNFEKVTENFREDPVSWFLNLDEKSRYHLTNIDVKGLAVTTNGSLQRVLGVGILGKLFFHRATKLKI